MSHRHALRVCLRSDLMLAGVCLLGFDIASKHVMAVLAVRVLAPRGRAQGPVAHAHPRRPPHAWLHCVATRAPVPAGCMSPRLLHKMVDCGRGAQPHRALIPRATPSAPARAGCHAVCAGCVCAHHRLISHAADAGTVTERDGASRMQWRVRSTWVRFE